MGIVHRTRLLYADPAWSFGDSLPGAGRGAAKNYKVMTVADIARFPLPEMMDDSWLWMWRVHTHQEEARFVMKAWGFEYVSELVWEKVTHKNGKPWFGMGRTLRMGHEICMIGRRGRPEPLSKSIRSTLTAPVPVDAKGHAIHSAKPLEMYPLIQSFSHGPYVELFARHDRSALSKHWTSFGNQLATPHPGASAKERQTHVQV